MAARAGGGGRAGEVPTQAGDVCVLRLLAALLQTLPHLLLQAYVVVAVDPAGFVPGEWGLPRRMPQVAEGVMCLGGGCVCPCAGQGPDGRPRCKETGKPQCKAAGMNVA